MIVFHQDLTRKSLPTKEIECNESGSGIKAIYQIPNFDLRKERKKKLSAERI